MSWHDPDHARVKIPRVNHGPTRVPKRTLLPVDGPDKQPRLRPQRLRVAYPKVIRRLYARGARDREFRQMRFEDTVFQQAAIGLTGRAPSLEDVDFVEIKSCGNADALENSAD